MTQASEKLPKFRKPPVVEVVLGAQFQPLPGIHIGHFGLLWDRLRKRFPRVEQQPALQHIIERRGGQAANNVPFIAWNGPIPMLPRLWMISEDNCELVQVQGDRFLRNWRRYHKQDLPYPTYAEHNRPAFTKDFSEFCAFAAENGWGTPEVDQCELTYINHIRTCNVWSDFGQLDRVFRGWSSEYPSLAGSPAEQISCRVRHEALDAEGNFVGHLYLEIDPALSISPSPTQLAEPVPVIQLQLTVRGRPFGPPSEGVMRFMDLAHRIIVKSFADITTSAMHKIWERIQ